MGLWMFCGNENAVFTMGWKTFAESEKGAAGQGEFESHVDDFYFTLRVLCIVTSYVRGI
jgi:hypothetical protein